MFGHLEWFVTQFPFQCTLTLTGVLSQNKFGYTEVTSVYSDEHCGHWHTLGVGSVSCGSITQPVWMFLLQFEMCNGFYWWVAGLQL